MNWHYATAGQAVGPISDADLEKLVQNGTIQPETLVWNETMPAWQPYSQVRPGMMGAQTASGGAGPAASSATAPGVQACSQCGTVVPSENLVYLGGLPVCANCKPLYLQKMREGLPIAGRAGMEYAGFWIRLAAKLVDQLVLAVVLVPLGVIVFVFGFSSRPIFTPGGGFNSAVLGMQALMQLATFIISTAYNWFFLAKYGATPGKMACGLKVVTPEGAPLGSPRALGRSAAEIVSRLTCLIGYIIAAFDEQKRALHDHMAGTRVVKK